MGLLFLNKYSKLRLLFAVALSCDALCRQRFAYLIYNEQLQALRCGSNTRITLYMVNLVLYYWNRRNGANAVFADMC